MTPAQFRILLKVSYGIIIKQRPNKEGTVNKSKWIEYENKKIRFTDFSGLKDEDFVSAITDSLEQDIKEFSRTPNIKQRILIDYSGSVINPGAAKALRESGEKSKMYTAKVAVIGITGVKKILLNLANQVTGNSLTAFDDRETALKWLVS